MSQLTIGLVDNDPETQMPGLKRFFSFLGLADDSFKSFTGGRVGLRDLGSESWNVTSAPHCT